MRGIRVAGVGLGMALGGVGLAGEPAARFGVRSEVLARGQAPQPGGILSPARPLPQGPTVTEQRTPPTTIAPPAASFGTPVPIGLPTTYLGLPPTVGAPPAIGPMVVSENIEPPLVGPGSAPAVGPFGILTGGHGFNGPSRLRLDADFLLWFVKSGGAPPLVATGVLDANNMPVPGTTRTLVGDESLSRNLHAGARFGATYWLDECSRWGLDGSLFFLARRGYNQTYNSAGDTPLFRPFTNANTNMPFVELVAAPGRSSGSVVVRGDTHAWGADANVRRHLAGGCDWRLDGLLGFRYLNFSESLVIDEMAMRLPGAPPEFGNPSVLSGAVYDGFRTENNFYGVNLGLTGEVRRGRWFAELRAAVALGTVFQQVSVEGSQQFQTVNGPSQAVGGLLALPGNIGTYSQRKFGVVPEVGLKLGCHLTDRWRVNVGYNFLYLNSVLRPGDQIDTGLDVTRIPNFPQPGAVPPLATVRPSPLLRDTGVFIQGISFGLQWAF